MSSPSIFHRDSTFAQKWRQRLAQRLDRHAVPESAMVMITAVYQHLDIVTSGHNGYIYH